jgi:hypothetical protein
MRITWGSAMLAEEYVLIFVCLVLGSGGDSSAKELPQYRQQKTI